MNKQWVEESWYKTAHNHISDDSTISKVSVSVSDSEDMSEYLFDSLRLCLACGCTAWIARSTMNDIE